MLPRIHSPHLEALGLPFVPESYNTVVRGAAGDHVIPVCLDAVQGRVMRLLPLLHTLPVKVRVHTWHNIMTWLIAGGMKQHIHLNTHHLLKSKKYRRNKKKQADFEFMSWSVLVGIECFSISSCNSKRIILVFFYRCITLSDS